MNLSQKKQLVLAIIENVWNENQIEEAASLIYEPYVIYHDPGDPWEGQSLDIETYKMRVQHNKNLFPNLHFVIHEWVEEGDRVVISWNMKGKSQVL